MASRLKNLRVHEISLVDVPANREPILLLHAASKDPLARAKDIVQTEVIMADTTLQVPEELAAVFAKLATAVQGEDEAVKALAKSAQPAARLLFRARALLATDALALLLKKDVETFARDAIAESEQRRQEAEERAAELARKRRVVKCGSVEIDVTDMPDAQRAGIEMMAKEQDKLAKKLADETRERRRRDAVAKAAKEFPSLKSDDVADLLVEAEDISKERLQKLEDVLKQAEALAKSGAATSEIGSAAADMGGDEWSRIEAAAENLRKTDASLTIEQAVDKILKTPEGRKLHKAYREAQQ